MAHSYVYKNYSAKQRNKRSNKVTITQPSSRTKIKRKITTSSSSMKTKLKMGELSKPSSHHILWTKTLSMQIRSSRPLTVLKEENRKQISKHINKHTKKQNIAKEISVYEIRVEWEKWKQLYPKYSPLYFYFFYFFKVGHISACHFQRLAHEELKIKLKK